MTAVCDNTIEFSRWRSSGGSIKGGFKLQSRPREGSRLRLSYDRFMTSPATPLLCDSRFQNSEKDKLCIYYGLDIRYHSRRHYWLVGYVGQDGIYRDCIAPRVSL